MKARTLFKATYAGTVVGDTVLGARLVGCSVGVTVGSTVVGDTVVSSAVGPKVGISVVGFVVGKIEGYAVGSSDGGLVEGSSVGFDVAIISGIVGLSLTAEGAHDGRLVGSRVGSPDDTVVVGEDVVVFESTTASVAWEGG